MNATLRWVLILLAVVGFLAATAAAIGIASLAISHTANLLRSNSQTAPRIVIGLDLSIGNPLIRDETFAARAGERVGEYIEKLPMRSEVSIRTFGDFNGSPEVLRFDRIVSLAQTAETIGNFVQTLITGMPKIVREEGQIEPHIQTNILGFLDSMSDSLECSERPTRVILITDGLEDSEYAMLADGNSALPDPSDTLYKDCEVMEMIGVGLGQRSPDLAKRIRDAWKAWASKAGFTDFVGATQW